VSDVQLAQIVHMGGFSGINTVTTGVAIVMAESGGQPKARNTNSDGSVDRGMWQINNKAHPDVSDSVADDPIGATKAAYKISNGGKNWKPWATYTSGKYLLFMPRAAAAVALIPLNTSPSDLAGQVVAAAPGGDAISGVATAISSATSVLVKTGQWIGNPHNWVRITEVLAGAVAVIIGLQLVARSGATGPAVAAARVPGRAAKAASSGAKKAGKAAAQVAAAVATDGASAAATGAAKAGKAASSGAAKAGKAATKAAPRRY
jgi:hypothetical protein